jgi:Family of unknown function (DUF5670)
MLLIIAIVIAVLWLGGFALFHVGSIIHVLLVVAIIVVVLHFLGFGTRRTA